MLPYRTKQKSRKGCFWLVLDFCPDADCFTIDQVSDPEVFNEWLNNTVHVNQSETIVLMEPFLYSVKLYVNPVFSSDKMFIFKNKSELVSCWRQ